MKRFLLLAACLFAAGCLRAQVGSVYTWPGGSDGDVQVNESGIFGGRTLTAGDNVTISTDSSSITISASGSGGGDGTSVYPATATASFPFGLSASTLTLTDMPGAGVLYVDAEGVVSTTTTSGTIDAILNQDTLQAGATFYVSSGTVQNLSVSTATVSETLTVDRIVNEELEFTFEPFISRTQEYRVSPFASLNLLDMTAASPGLRIFDIKHVGGAAGGVTWDMTTPKALTVTDESDIPVHRLQIDGGASHGIGYGAHGYGLSVAGSLAQQRIHLSASQVLKSTHAIVFADASGGNITFSLPNIGGPGFGEASYTRHIIRKIGGTNTVTFNAPGANDSIEAVTLAADGDFVIYYGDKAAGSTGTGTWRILSKGIAPSGSGDNLGNHIATMTITAGYGIDATTATFSSLTASQFVKTDGSKMLVSSAAIAVSEIQATGTPSDSTVLHGDGVWREPAGGEASISTFTVTVPISAASLAATVTDGFTGGVQTGETATNKVNFDYVALSSHTTNYFQFSYSLPEGWDGSTVTFQPIWTASGGTGAAVFALQALGRGDNEEIDVAYGTAVTVTDTLQNTDRVHVAPESGALTIGGTPTPGEYMVWRGYRDYLGASDTLEADVKLLEIRIRFTRDELSD